MRGFVSGARAAVVVAGATAAVGAALVNDRRLVPALATGAVPAAPPIPAYPRLRPRTPEVRFRLEPHLRRSAVAAVGVVALVAMLVAAISLMYDAVGPSTFVPAGPAGPERPAAAVGGDWARAYADAAPSAGELGAAVVAGVIQERSWRSWQELQYMVSVAEQEQARQAAAQSAASARVRSVAGAQAAPPASSASANTASGYAPGTVLRARITIYGCIGPGGGFCGGMASGFSVYEGAVACSYDLPFGTKLTIEGDPTGRVYECLDRGALSNTWVDVFFYDTSEGIAWASQLGGTVANITIVN